MIANDGISVYLNPAYRMLEDSLGSRRSPSLNQVTCGSGIPSAGQKSVVGLPTITDRSVISPESGMTLGTEESRNKFQPTYHEPTHSCNTNNQP